MKLEYKGIEIERDEHGFISVASDNEDLTEALRACNVSVMEIQTIQKYIRANNIKLLDNKADMEGKKIATVGKVVGKDLVKKGLINYTMRVPGYRSYFEISGPDGMDLNEYYELEGELKEDTWYNTKRASNLERRLGYLKHKFKTKYKKKIKIKEDVETYSKPRYELHCHTVHSKRDAHITHDQLKESFESGKLGALAITNHGINNCFPDSIKAFTKGNNNVIPAVELYVVDDEKLELEISAWEMENEEGLTRKYEIAAEMAVSLQLEADVQKIIDDKSYGKGQAGVYKKEAVGHRKVQRELKKELKEIEAEEKKLLLTKPNLGDAQRRHVTCLVSAKDSSFKFRGKDVAFNPGIVELNKAITKANTENFAVPVTQKWMGKSLPSYGELT